VLTNTTADADHLKTKVDELKNDENAMALIGHNVGLAIDNDATIVQITGTVVQGEGVMVTQTTSSTSELRVPSHYALSELIVPTYSVLMNYTANVYNETNYTVVNTTYTSVTTVAMWN
jgi:RNase P/RNase MRP subunit p29